ncbi:hypothetical protein HGRIS_001321 [Hohenbuehelia grisea]|uniref:Uncharacterized protein n=1 Tax=Hohenbuehelia grisea TaxID=104357 RepID=A0ABR3JPS2_9AGAR
MFSASEVALGTSTKIRDLDRLDGDADDEDSDGWDSESGGGMDEEDDLKHHTGRR